MARWTRADYGLCAAVLMLCASAVLLIPIIPGLQAQYGGMSGVPSDKRLALFAGGMVWTFSWLLGWEFMHRYYLLQIGRASCRERV